MTHSSPRVFELVMIKPTHYDDDGYPIQWFRSVIPSNTLAAVNGLLRDCAERQVLGPDVEIRGRALDETNTRIRPERIIRDLRRKGHGALIAFVGVQSNQFPRAVDLARPFLDAGLPVAIGGFHVSGCIAMLPELPAEIVEAQRMGIAIFAGEAEDGRLDRVLQDAHAGRMQPVYDFMNDLPGLEHQPYPFLPRSAITRTQNDFSSFDLGRGCPYQCSFCTIINVQGRKSRFRSADDLEKIVRANAAQGIYKFFITDDDLARNRSWESFFDRLIHLKQSDGLRVELFVQVDTSCHRIPNFIEKACRAGVTRVFLGLENINPDNLVAAKKRQNKITEYRYMLQQWRDNGANIYAGYILGFPGDTRDRILHDIEIIKRELPIDVLEFFFLTPLPGSEDHQRDHAAGRWMDPDLNKYDLMHRVTHHPIMSDAEWDAAYHDAWHCFYTWDHIETIGRRGASAPRRGVHIDEVTEFISMYTVEGVHPLEGGILRRKHRRDRRPGLPRVNPLLFYPALAAETAGKMARLAWNLLKARRIHNRIYRDPDQRSYTDLAITPPTPAEYQELGLFRETAGGAGAVRRQKVLEGTATAAE